MRTSGYPSSSNGASSFHLLWDVPAGHFVGAAVEFELAAWPSSPDLIFWALQASFADAAGTVHGGAHLGLQWHPRARGRTAACWGGYANSGGELGGGPILNGGSLGPNVAEFAFAPGVRYRFVIEPHPDGWAGRIQTTSTSETLRVLHSPGDRLVGLSMWTEAFCRCDAPSVAAAWFRPCLLTPGGGVVDVRKVRTNYQAESAGGCSNTNLGVVRTQTGELGVVQRTGVERRTPPGAILDLADSPPRPALGS